MVEMFFKKKIGMTCDTAGDTNAMSYSRNVVRGNNLSIRLIAVETKSESRSEVEQWQRN